MSLSRKFLKELLESEEGQQRIQDIWDEVSTKRRQTVGHAYNKQTGRNEPIKFEVYPLKDALAFLSWAATYGIGKPPEEKKIAIDVNHIQQLSDAELYELAEADVRELPPGD